MYWGHKLYLITSHDVIDDMTIQLAICYFLRLQDMCIQIYLVTTLTRQGHVTLLFTWPFDSPNAISYRWSFVTESLSPAIYEIMSPKHGRHDIDFSRLGDVIGHVTNRFAICHFLVVSDWNRVSIFNRFRDICIQIFTGHSRSWHFMVTWRHRSRDQWIRHMTFPIGVPLERNLYF